MRFRSTESNVPLDRIDEQEDSEAENTLKNDEFVEVTLSEDASINK